MDLADAAGVSTATVDRVLNQRPGVSARTRAHVINAARKIGYLPDVDDAPGAPISLAILLPRGTNRFIAELRGHLITAAKAAPGVRLNLPQIAGLDPADMADAIRAAQDCHGIALIAVNHPLVREALLRATADGLPVVTLASDLPDSGRRAYIGIDDMRAGRLAGQVLHRFMGPPRPGKVAVFTGTLSYRGHQEREMGLRQYLAEDAPHLDMLTLRESHEDRDRAYDLACALLDKHPDLSAIYNAGGGTLGIARALQEAKAEIIFVAHEATDENKALLLDGTLDAVIDQDARAQAQEAIATLAAAARGHDYTPITPRLQLILRENLPADFSSHLT